MDDRSDKELLAPPSGATSRGFEIALTMLVFVGIGYVLDAWLGTTPLFMIGLSVFAAVGSFVKLRLGYDQQMERLEAERRNGLQG